VNGANQGALYARESGNILGQQKITRPAGHTWRSFAEMLLESMPERTEEHYRAKITLFIRWWNQRGHGGVGSGYIPDEADPKLEAARKAPSWRRICKALLRNDYWCKGLSFCQHKSNESYARYRALMRRRAREWSEPVDNRPTPGQLGMLSILAGGKGGNEHGWSTLADERGSDVASAKSHATTHHAAAAIRRLRQ
jgi:hypothetical protein